jgi:hypothetical protein
MSVVWRPGFRYQVLGLAKVRWGGGIKLVTLYTHRFIFVISSPLCINLKLKDKSIDLVHLSHQVGSNKEGTYLHDFLEQAQW